MLRVHLQNLESEKSVSALHHAPPAIQDTRRQRHFATHRRQSKLARRNTRTSGRQPARFICPPQRLALSRNLQKLTRREAVHSNLCHPVAPPTSALVQHQHALATIERGPHRRGLLLGALSLMICAASTTRTIAFTVSV